MKAPLIRYPGQRKRPRTFQEKLEEHSSWQPKVRRNSCGLTIYGLRLAKEVAMSGFVHPDGSASVSVGGAQTVAIASGTATDTVIKASGGRLCRALVTAQNTNAMFIYDNASGHTGTTIGVVP